MKEKKREIKNNSPYFRVVKQGSVLVYLTFHIITIFTILLMAVMRQSLLSLGYVLVLLPRFKDAAAVLDQRSIHKNKAKDELTAEVAHLKRLINELQAEGREETDGELLELEE
jgi:hypothetical protein